MRFHTNVRVLIVFFALEFVVFNLVRDGANVLRLYLNWPRNTNSSILINSVLLTIKILLAISAQKPELTD